MVFTHLKYATPFGFRLNFFPQNQSLHSLNFTHPRVVLNVTTASHPHALILSARYKDCLFPHHGIFLSDQCFCDSLCACYILKFMANLQFTLIFQAFSMSQISYTTLYLPFFYCCTIHTGLSCCQAYYLCV